jgi:hypothetical protein
MAKKKFYSKPPMSRYKPAEPKGSDPIYKKGDRVYRPSPDGMVLDTIEKTRTMDGIITYDVKNGMGTYVAPELRPTDNISFYQKNTASKGRRTKSRKR